MMKIYDKEIYKTQEKLRSAILVIVIFILGFFAGFMTNKFTLPENKIEDTNNTVQNDMYRQDE